LSRSCGLTGPAETGLIRHGVEIRKERVQKTWGGGLCFRLKKYPDGLCAEKTNLRFLSTSSRRKQISAGTVTPTTRVFVIAIEFVYVSHSSKDSDNFARD
jgi:hypothetical protein